MTLSNSLFQDIQKIGIVNLSFGIVTIISCILTVIFYLKSIKIKKPYFRTTSINLVDSELKQLDGIEITYKGSHINSLTATRISFWNGGNDTIDKNDIPEKSPLAIEAKNSNVLIYAVDVVSMSDVANNVKIEQNKSSDLSESDKFIVSFDYLDKYQGGQIKVLHSGSSRDDITISGKIKGVGNFTVIEESPTDSETKIPLIVFTVLLLIGGILSKSTGWKIVLLSLAALLIWVLIKILNETPIPKEFQR